MKKLYFVAVRWLVLIVRVVVFNGVFLRCNCGFFTERFCSRILSTTVLCILVVVVVITIASCWDFVGGHSFTPMRCSM